MPAARSTRSQFLLAETTAVAKPSAELAHPATDSLVDFHAVGVQQVVR